LTGKPPERGARTRHWLVDASFGGVIALGLITAAEASRPQVVHLAALPHLRLGAAPVAPARRAPRPAPPPVLIAFQQPLPGYPIISPFGLRQLPWEEGGRLHAGVDIAAPAGLPALAAADGVVTRVDVDPGYGRFVELKHAAGLSTRYAHLRHALPQIAPGVALKAGSPVGEIGSTGSSTGAHLHFEIRDDQDRPLNPELFLGRSFARTIDLPLRAALRIPRGVRLAYVSNIPKAKREAMQAKAEEEAAADDGEDARSGRLAQSAGDAGVDASAAARDLRYVHGRPRARLTARN
jgi:murein DD-endopeptidase MepM/ murein hydrolase activator NlpD